MRKLLVLSSMGLIITFAISCTPKKSSSGSSSSNTTANFTKEQASVQFSAGQIAEGETITKAKCGNCHKLHNPTEFGAEKWHRVLNRMIPKTKVSEEDGKLIRAYVIANSKAVNG